METIILFLVLIFSFFNSKDEATVNVIDVLSVPKAKISNLSYIATDVEYIPLETTDNSLISRIFDLRATDDFIYVRTLDKILCFNNSGKYLFAMDKQGRGPEEYEFLIDFDINRTSTILAIPCRKELLMYKQTDKGFIFMNRLMLSASPSKINFTPNTDNILLQYSNTEGTNQYSRELINLRGETLKSCPNYMKYERQEKITVVSRYENTSYCYRNSLYLKEVGNDTIFKLNDNNTVESFLIFNTKDKRVTPEVRSNVRYYAEHMFEYFILQKIFGSERFIYYTYSYNKRTGAELYDQLKKIRYNVSEKEFFTDDITGGVSFEPQYCYNGLFYSWVDALKLKAYISGETFRNAKAKDSAKNRALKNLTDNLTEFDNPVLIIAKIK